MTRKDYVAIAAALNRAFPAIESPEDINDFDSGKRRGFVDTVETLCGVFSEDNPRFDGERFRSAVYNG